MSTMEDRMASTEGRMAEVERTLAEIAAINREMQEANRETREENRAYLHRLQEENRAYLHWLQEENRVSIQRLQEERHAYVREMREADRQIREEVRESNRKWGELANKMGTLVEDVLAPGVPTVFRTVFGGDRFDATYQRMRRTHATDPSREREFDYVVVTRDLVLITQTKTTLASGHIRQMLILLGTVRNYLPEYKDKRFAGALASFSVEPSLVIAGERRGLLMFGLGTGLLQILNTPGFQPTRF